MGLLSNLRKRFLPRRPAHEPLVLAVTRRYPTRLALYAAAFQGGWKVQFYWSVGEAAEAAKEVRPRAVFYDRAIGDPGWRRCCSDLAENGVPFLFLARTHGDDAFLAVMAAGGYPVSGDPITSEEIVRAVEFAGEVAALGPSCLV